MCVLYTVCVWLLGVLFMTSVSDSDPDQFVYRSHPPRADATVESLLTTNSYLGLWDVRGYYQSFQPSPTTNRHDQP